MIFIFIIYLIMETSYLGSDGGVLCSLAGDVCSKPVCNQGSGFLPPPIRISKAVYDYFVEYANSVFIWSGTCGIVDMELFEDRIEIQFWFRPIGKADCSIDDPCVLMIKQKVEVEKLIDAVIPPTPHPNTLEHVFNSPEFKKNHPDMPLLEKLDINFINPQDVSTLVG